MLAVCENPVLPSHLVSMLLVFALYANNESGEGITGQETLAELTHVSVKTLFRYQQELAGIADSPVILERKSRGRKAGRADLYRLILKPGANPRTVFTEQDESVTVDRYNDYLNRSHLTGTTNSIGQNGPLTANESVNSDRRSAECSTENTPTQIIFEKTAGGASGLASPPEPAAERTAKGKAAATTLPVDWSPNAHCSALAASYGLDLVEAVTDFRLDAKASGRRAADWQAAFELYLNIRRNMPGFKRRHATNGPEAKSVRIEAEGYTVEIGDDFALYRGAKLIARTEDFPAIEQENVWGALWHAYQTQVIEPTESMVREVMQRDRPPSSTARLVKAVTKAASVPPLIVEKVIQGLRQPWRTDAPPLPDD
jgi:hypothetical protein